MNTVVCVKQGPDTAAERTLRLADGTLDRESPDRLINELDESAIEDGLKIAEAHGSEVTIASMGPGKAAESIRKALSMGAGKAVHLIYDALARSDALGTQPGHSAPVRRYRHRPPLLQRHAGRRSQRQEVRQPARQDVGVIDVAKLLVRAVKLREEKADVPGDTRTRSE